MIPHIPPRVTACCLFSWFAWTVPAGADNALLLASKTNTLIQVADESAQLSNGLGDIYVGRTNQDGQGPATISIRRGLLEFDPAATIPQGALITSVVLTLNDVRGLNGNQTVTLSSLFHDWGQGKSFFNGGQGASATNGDATWYCTFYIAADPSASPTWTVPGGLAGVDYSATPCAAAMDIASGTANQSCSWSSSANPAMLNDVQGWLDDPATNCGWIILGNESAGQTAKRFGGQYATAPEAPPQLAVQYLSSWIWSGSASSEWSLPGNWTAGAGTPGAGACILVGDSHAKTSAVNLVSATTSITRLTFDANKTMTITSTPADGQFTFDNGDNSAAIVVSGSGHTIDATVAITLNSDLLVTINGSSDSLCIAGDIDNGSAAHGLVKNGLGLLILSGSNGFTGGIVVSSGTLVINDSAALADGSSLIVGAASESAFGAIIAGTSAANSEMRAATSVSTVPEPGTLMLLIASSCVMAYHGAIRSQRRTFDVTISRQVEGRTELASR